MVTRAARNLSRDQRALIDAAIAGGTFRDLEEFEDFAVRQAVAHLRLRKLQEGARKHPHTPAEILREARAVRRSVAKKYGA